MPQTIKISAGYADKVSENYNSQQFSVSLEMACTITGKISEVESAADRLFALCRKIVDRQKGINVDNLLTSDLPDTHVPAPQ